MAIRLIALLGAGLFPLSAVASDYGTYRPGNTYMSVPATSPEQCISQCQGDAQCKGWNFVQVSPVRMICEFNARKVPPIASAISISGDNATTMDSYRVIPGGQRTVRVGQMPKMVSRPSSVTRIGAMTPPSRPQVTAAAHRSRPVQRTQVQRPVPRLPAAPQIRPEPQTASAPAYAARTMPAPSSSFKPQLDTMTPAPQYSRPQYEQPQYDQPRYEQSPQAEAAPRFRPQLDSIAPMPEIAPMPAPTPATAPMSGPSTEQYAYAGPPISEAPADYIPPTIRAEDVPGLARPQAMPNPALDLAGGPIAGNLPARNSLYGSLYDDVKAPRSLGPDDIPADPDAPISTVTSVPVKPGI